MKWLVSINDEGIQCQFLMGRDLEISAAKEKEFGKNVVERSKIVHIFEKGPISDDYTGTSSLGEIIRKRRANFYKGEEAWSDAEKIGYDLRKRSLGKYIEVLAELDADNLDEFEKNYSGYKGAIAILYSTEKVMWGAGSGASKAVAKMIRKLEIEAED